MSECAKIFASAWRFCASIVNILAIVLILFAVSNFAALFVINRSEQETRGQRERIIDLFISRHGIETLRAAHPRLSDQQIRELLITTGVVGNRYYPYVEFIQAAFISPEVLIRPEGFRVIGQDQASWPPPANGRTVFVFGSSTTFGNGVFGYQTIPAYLQSWLRANFNENINVYNFGTGAHYSTQEILFFYDWLRKGVQPDLAIFVDGMNETAFPDDRSALSSFLDQAYERHAETFAPDQMRQPSLWSPLREFLLALPLARAVKGPQTVDVPGLFNGHVEGLRKVDDFSELQRPASADELAASRRVLDRYAVNVKAGTGIGSANGVETYFVWQPAPLYKYDLRFHPYAVQTGHQVHRVSYPMMADRVKNGALPSNFGWCADVQEGHREILYVDQLHYRPVLAELVAACAVEKMAMAGVFDRLGWKRKLPRLEAPDVRDEQRAVAASEPIVEVAQLARSEPDRFHASNVSVAGLGISGSPDGILIISPIHPNTEHYLQVVMGLNDPGQYLLTMKVRAKDAGSFRLQAWDSAAAPNGIIADVRFAGEQIKISTILKGSTDVAQVVRRGDLYDVTLELSLPEGLSRLVIQNLDSSGNGNFTADGQSLVISDLRVLRAP
jgi:hypothetical protein